MALSPHMLAKAREMARRKFSNDVLLKLRAKRLGAAVKPPQKEPDADDELGGFDALEQMYHAGGEHSGR